MVHFRYGPSAHLPQLRKEETPEVLVSAFFALQSARVAPFREDFLPRMARIMAVQKAVCRVFIREIREIRGSIPLVAAVRAGPFALFAG